MSRGHVFFDFRQRGQLPVGEGKGQGGDGLGAQLAVARHRPSGRTAQLRPDQHQRQLVGQQFVIGQPPPHRCFRRQVGLMHGRMRRRQRLAERREAFALQKRRILPFRHHRHLRQCAAHRLGQRLCGQALGQGIDRLMLGQRAASSTT